MSNIHAYGPQNGGSILSYLYGPSVPVRDPITGWFISSKEKSELDDGPIEKALDLSFETAEECEERIYGESLDDPLTGGDNYGLSDWSYDKYDTLAETIHEPDDWAYYLGLPWYASLEEQTEAWAEYQYGHLAVYGNPEDEAEEIGEAYEHLPHFESRVAVMSQGAGWFWNRYKERKDRGYHPGCKVHTPNGMSKHRKGWHTSDSHGRHGRLNGSKLRKHCDIRRNRQNTHRQTEYIWLAEMGETVGMTSECYLDGFSEVLDNEDHLEDVNTGIKAWNFAELDRAYKRGEFGNMLFFTRRTNVNYHEFTVNDIQMDKAQRKPRHHENADIWGESYHDCAGFYDWESKKEIERDEEDARYYAMMADMGPTQEEWDAMDDIALAEAKTEEELFLQYEHLPASNATGTKARMAQRTLIDA